MVLIGNCLYSTLESADLLMSQKRRRLADLSFSKISRFTIPTHLSVPISAQNF